MLWKFAVKALGAHGSAVCNDPITAERVLDNRAKSYKQQD